MKAPKEIEQYAEQLDFEIKWENWNDRFAVIPIDEDQPWPHRCLYYEPGREEPFGIHLCDNYGDDPYEMTLDYLERFKKGLSVLEKLHQALAGP